MLNLYIACCQKLYTQHCHFLYIVNLLVTLISVGSNCTTFALPLTGNGFAKERIRKIKLSIQHKRKQNHFFYLLNYKKEQMKNGFADKNSPTFNISLNPPFRQTDVSGSFYSNGLTLIFNSILFFNEQFSKSFIQNIAFSSFSKFSNE